MLKIDKIQIEDDQVYLCERTYLEPRENCDPKGGYVIQLQVLGK